jgi:hypothetical protein
MDYGAKAGMKFDCTIYGKAADENDAYEEAGIAASERGCANVMEVVVGVFE